MSNITTVPVRQVSDPAKSPGTVQRRAEEIRVAVIGCGAVSQLFHIPVLAGHHRIRIAALVDPNEQMSAKLARAYKVPLLLKDTTGLFSRDVDAAVVATPPRFHAPIATELLQRGIHVLVEKPMAMNSTEARSMVAAARAAGRTLAVGYFRRLFRSSRMVNSLLASGAAGRPLKFEAEEGTFFDWGAATLGSMQRHSAGGGVLIDTGSHTLDQLLSFFDGPAELIDYADDCLGGIESDCRLTLRIFHQGEPVEGVVKLSRTRKLANRFRIHCERGVIELATSERETVTIHPHSIVLDDPALQRPHEYELTLGWNDTASLSVFDAFRAQVDDWLRAIQTGEQPYLDGESALRTVQLIDECYRSPKHIELPWVTTWIKKDVSGISDPPAQSADQPTGKPTSTDVVVTSMGNFRSRPRRRVLITGASGFIGCRMAEILSLRDEWEVKALVHHPSSASRLARLPVEMICGDVACKEELRCAATGCDVIVHCAYGTSFVRREAIAATVAGTRIVAEVAQENGVDRLIYMSTTAVNGTHWDGVLDESTPHNPDNYDYAISKSRAEQVLSRLLRQGCRGVVFRLPNVYGPFSKPYTIRAVAHLNSRIPVLVGSGRNPSNTIYVDNVVEAVVRATEVPAEKVVGEIFTLNDDEATWADYFSPYADAMGVPMEQVTLEDLTRIRASQQSNMLSVFPKAGQNLRMLLQSSELKALAQRFVTTDPIGYLPRWAIERVPGFRPFVRRVLQLDKPEVFVPQVAQESTAANSLDVHLLNIYACPALVSTKKARRVLGDFDTVSRAKAMQLTVDWCRYSGLIEEKAALGVHAT